MPEKKSFPLEQISFLAALCMFLSVIEYAIPKPLPFLRLGLANLPILISIKKLRPKEIFVLILLKIFMQALVSGTLFSYIVLFSFSGSVASGLVMLIGYFIFFRTGCFSNIGLSLTGAFANSGMQLVCARFLMFGDNVKFIVPVMLISSFVTGLALGIFANFFENKSVWFEKFCGKTDVDTKNQEKATKVMHRKSTDCKNGNEFVDKLWKSSVFRMIFSLIFMILLMFVKNIWVQFGIVLLFFALAMIKKRGKVKWIPSLVVLISITIFSLFNPSGKVLLVIVKWKITLGALILGLQRSFLLIGMVFISQFMIDKNISLPGKLGFMVESIFLVYDRLVVDKISFKNRNIIEAIDEKLLSISR